ncbi:MAG: rRNA cytosine-C5-methyltransferase [Candidatus Azobacteroides sp.]|nr:rRNA cytosine-C5-methyltransferase [Candidatus Azobacteroides sp.]
MNLPEAFLSQIKPLLGSRYDSFIRAMEEEATTSIRFKPLNPLKGTWSVKDRSYLRFFQKQKSPLGDLGVESVPWASNAFYLNERPSFTFDPLFHAGCYYVQEASSMFLEQIIKAHVSAPVKCLDLCAAPGGKSTLLSSTLPEGSLLVANEVIRSRSHILKENLIKWGNPNVIVTNNDPKIIGKSLPGFFDLIVTDVPCSGEGMFRKDKNAIFEWSLENVTLCAERQQRIIADIWPALKPGGILIYSTCTFNLKENEENIHWLVNTFGAEPLDVVLKENWNITRAKKYNYPVFRFIPGQTKGEGFFIAAVKKSGDSSSGHIFNKFKKEKAKKDKTLVPPIIKNWIKDYDSFFIEVNENFVSAIPEIHQSDYLIIKDALRVIYAGITICEIKGKDVIPNHALAMSEYLNRESFPSVDVDKETAIAYLRREPIQLTDDMPKGYVLLTYQNHPTGFVKNLGNRTNSLYPQEWRIRTAYQ